MMVPALRQVSTGERPLSDFDGYLTESVLRAFAVDPRLTLQNAWMKLLFEYQDVLMLEWFNQAIAIAQRPDHEQPALWRAFEDQLDRFRHHWYAPFTGTVPILVSPMFFAAAQAHLRHQSEFGAFVVLLASERHRQKTGHWPESDSEIDPALLPDPPLDPFSGQPFRIEHRDGQFLVYSVGPNGQDEHGSYELRKYHQTKRNDDFGVRAWDPFLTEADRRSGGLRRE